MHNIKFLVDENLLGLLKRLRMMGIDSISVMGASDNDIDVLAREQGRVILTKDRRFFNKVTLGKAYFVKSERPKAQLIEVLSQFPCVKGDETLSRCFSCNSLIEQIEKERVKDLVDEKTYRLYDSFYQCPTCHRIYWEGSHFEKMQKEIQAVLGQVNKKQEN